MKVKGQYIRQLREDRGLSLAELAQQTQLSVSYLSEIERGAKTPSLKTLEKIAGGLNTPRSQLLEDTTGVTVSLGERLRVIREERGLSLSELAEKVSISPSYLSEIERDNVYPAVHTLKALAGTLKVSVSTLVGPGGAMGQKLRRAREEQGLSQAALARSAGVSPGLVGQIEHGRVQPSLQTIEKLAGVMGISPCYLIVDDADSGSMLEMMGPDLRELLGDPQVQSVLRLVCNCTEEELRFIFNFIKLYKQSHRGMMNTS
ncbi:MAG: transcriptional regulator [Clostridia bacterium]|nr:MAG: transcriptional regulator [Clostridia bacterium]